LTSFKVDLLLDDLSVFNCLLTLLLRFGIPETLNFPLVILKFSSFCSTVGIGNAASIDNDGAGGGDTSSSSSVTSSINELVSDNGDKFDSSSAQTSSFSLFSQLAMEIGSLA
jgi:hypothetical protein